MATPLTRSRALRVACLVGLIFAGLALPGQATTPSAVPVPSAGPVADGLSALALSVVGALGSSDDLARLRVTWQDGDPRAVEAQMRLDAQAWRALGTLEPPAASVEVEAPVGGVLEVRIRHVGSGEWLASPPRLLGRSAASAARLLDPPLATVLIAGDIAGCDWDPDSATARLVAASSGLVMTAGDNAYDTGSEAEFATCYAATWGRFKARTRPVPGNHDHATPGATGYFRYFGDRAGPFGRGWYAFDHGTWRIYALDSDCEVGDRCRRGSRQYRWLKADLGAHPRRCVMAVLHHPNFSSGPHGNSARTTPLLSLLYEAGAELIVNGHDHVYERFAPARPWGRPDPEHGLRQFIVGTGGAPLYSWKSAGRPAHSEVRQNSTHGVLQLQLEWGAYAWRFLAVDGASFSDSGTGVCHGAPGADPAGGDLPDRDGLDGMSEPLTEH